MSSILYPSAGGLPLEDVVTTYSDLGLPETTYSGLQWYVSESLHTKYAEVAQLTFDPDGPNANETPVAWQAYTYEDGTRRVSGSTFQISTGPNHVVTDLTYDYTDAGLITSIDNQSDLGADTQCFVYDYLKRVTDAWTGSTPAACDAQPTGPEQVDGAAPYWQSWTFDDAGNRTSQVDHLAAQTIDYTYSASQPHTLTSAQITTPEGSTTLSYGYDTAGNTTTRPDGSGGAQTLTWSVDGKLETLEAGGDVTDYDYTAGGSRITRTDPDGTITAFLPGMEVVKNPDGTVTASRYYAHGGQQVAVRTNDNSLYWLASDHQGTSTATVDSLTHLTSVRHHDLYGNERGTPPVSWVDDHGFLDGVKDPSGLTHLGAREYDPILGRFISADPVLDATSSQQMGGYAYANHSPVSFTDPTGLTPGFINGASCIDGDCSYHDPDGSIRDDCGQYAGSSAACGQGYGTSAVSDDERTDAVAEDMVNPDLKEDVDKARDILNTSIVDVVIKVGADILLDLIGVNDIMSCVGSGDMLACASLLMDLIPFTKIIKLGAKLFKAAKKIYKAVTGFQDKLAWARSTMNRYNDAVSAAWDRAKRKVDARRASAPSCDVGNSFTADTEVLLADGTTKPISQLEPGDEVIATDEETGETTTREITTTIEGTGDKTLVEIGVDNDGDSRTDATITATDRHPIWAADPAATPDGSGSGGGGPPTANQPATAAYTDSDTTQTGGDHHQLGVQPGPTPEPLPGLWTDAIDLQAGQLLRTSTGTWAQITSVETRTEHTTVHNLTVASTHTYYVIAGDTPLLVHNCNTPKGFSGKHDYNDFVNTLNGGLSDAGYSGTTAAFQGSSVTGVSFKSGRAFGSQSDYDIALGGQDIFDRAVALGVPLRSGGTRTGPLKAGQLEALGLSGLRGQLSGMAGRPVNFMIYNNIEGAMARSPSLLARVCGC